jgi:hypothetical protein
MTVSERHTFLPIVARPRNSAAGAGNMMRDYGLVPHPRFRDVRDVVEQRVVGAAVGVS